MDIEPLNSIKFYRATAENRNLSNSLNDYSEMRDPFQPKHMRSAKPPRGWVKARRVTAYQAPPTSRFKRFLRFFINPWLVTLVLVFVLGGFLTFTYFWFEFSDQIDRRLLGEEIFTPSAGIY